MPGPVTHIVTAEKLASLLEIKDIDAFRAGSLFPDIRMLGVIERERTHFKNITIEDVKNASSDYQAGFLLHSLLDELHERYVRKQHVYDTLPDEYASTVALKICEDSLLYGHYPDWKGCIRGLEHVYPEQQALDIPLGKIRLWHEMLQTFFSKPPLQSIGAFLRPTDLSDHEVDKMIALADQVRTRKLIEDYIYSFIENIDRHIFEPLT